MSAHSRNKGAAFEREIAVELFHLTGVSFQRNLEQCRDHSQGDLTPDDPAWPFVIECKRRSDGFGCSPAWQAQARRAADAASKIPAVVYRFDRLPPRACVPLSAIHASLPADEWADVSLAGLAYLARELMAAPHV